MNIEVNITYLLEIILWLSIFYLIARVLVFIAKDWVSKTNVKWQKKYISNAEALLSPIVIMIALCLMLLTNPLWTALVLIVSYLGFKDFIRNYYLGLYFKLNNKLSSTSNITTNGMVGKLSEFATLGIWVNTDSGLQFVNYRILYKGGFVLNDNSHISTSYSIIIENVGDQELEKFSDILVASPYLDSEQNISISADENRITAKLNLRNQEYYKELIAYIKENNFTIITE